MTAEQIVKEIKSTLKDAHFFYKGEIYDKDTNCLGYIPDLTHMVAVKTNMTDEEEEHLDEYCQTTLYDTSCSNYEYACRLESFLITLMYDLLRNEND